MKTYKLVFVCPVGHYTMNHVNGENILVAIGKAISIFKKEYPIYPCDIISIERIDKSMPQKLLEDENWSTYFEGSF
jgi:hypothetical protein